MGSKHGLTSTDDMREEKATLHGRVRLVRPATIPARNITWRDWKLAEDMVSHH